MRLAAWLIGCLAIGSMWTGCSSTDNHPKGAAGSAGQEGGMRDGGPHDPTLNCVKPGTPNNEKGVGGYCESSAECQGDVGGFFLCSGDFESTPPNAWFCTTFCTFDSDCGANAYCGHSDLGGGCVPLGCGPGPEAGVADAAVETNDGAADVTPDAAPDVTPESGPEAEPDAAADVSADIAPESAPDASFDAPSDASSDGGNRRVPRVGR